ncbi:type II toxin-antitoxin system antitoxin SocA domain-containing protein [Methylovulum sp.]|uniref:Panacea domain-containing protein n=1 Tax=Methylovulum sp. TaxID=1916980 RepID=UPI0026255CE2|nr:type II toxin-antitoxin system antitoxin SocA domain-containing protein [Methylovulum sp.]MDD5125379.1 DUF4065 domain-containing protein [Methylovulum sp.]
MTVSSHAIANEFIALAKSEGKALTNMQLQKLVFISQGYTLAILEHPLYFHNTHAWQWGPVIPKLYKPLQKYGRNFVTESLESEDVLDQNSEEMEIIKAVWDGYGHLSGGRLSELTHKPNTPWSITWENNQFGIIPENLIAEHYKGIVESA